MLTPSIITSFIASGFLTPDPVRQPRIQDCFKNLRKDFYEYFLQSDQTDPSYLPVELYILMEPDFLYLKTELDLPDSMGLTGFLNKLITDSALLEKTYEFLADRFRRMRITPIAFASFFPEISHADATRRSQTFGAVSGMQRLAQRFNQEDQWQIRAIELVCGSRIAGVEFEEDRKRLISTLIPPDQTGNTLEKLIDGLDATVADQDRNNVIPYSLELEPGSMFLVNSAESIARIAELLAESTSIGFNLDLSHYSLAGLLKQDDTGTFHLTEALTKNKAFETFRRHIVHAHISDSSEKGHLGDLPFGSIHAEDYFRKQIQFLKTLTSQGDSALPFSNHLSLELEAVGRWREIEDSFKILCQLCRES
ncbi:hypothetical protein [Gimesia maris]|uniref:hypothetical protein n=1 Tax=Gimesia maris TaxID=122 RepID=UPI0030DB06AD|tara:strand:- start:19270 stop:20367 length:1098 start_codon:yes stop_codon:yes gene_type:complete